MSHLNLPTTTVAEILRNLSQPLIVFLEADPKPIIDIEAQDCLHYVRKIVDMTLLEESKGEKASCFTDKSSIRAGGAKDSENKLENRPALAAEKHYIYPPVGTSKQQVPDSEIHEVEHNNDGSPKQSRDESHSTEVSPTRVNRRTTSVEIDFYDKQRASLKILPMEGPKSAADMATSSEQSTTYAEKEQLPQQTGGLQKRRVLIAVNPVEEMDERQSNMTMMLWIFGPRFNRWWLSKMMWVSLLFVSGMVWNGITTVTLLFLPDIWDKYCWPMAAGTLLWCLVSIIQYSFLLNAHVLRRCLRTFEARVLLMEASLFSFSIWSMLCFSPSAFSLALACFSLCLPYIFYDGYRSASARSKSKKFLAAGALHLFCTLVIFYGRIYKGERCYYKLDLVYGLTLVPSDIYEHVPAPSIIAPTAANLVTNALQGDYPASSDATGVSTVMPPSSRWNLSLYDFCLNRGITLLIVMLKIIYAAYKHPRDCAIIKTAMRVVESNSTAEATKRSERPLTPTTERTAKS